MMAKDPISSPLHLIGDAARKVTQRYQRQGVGSPPGDGPSNTDDIPSKHKLPRKHSAPLARRRWIMGFLVAGGVAGGAMVMAGDWRTLLLVSPPLTHDLEHSPVVVMPSMEELDELFDATEQGEAAARNALSFYTEGTMPAMALFSTDRFREVAHRDASALVTDDDPALMVNAILVSHPDEQNGDSAGGESFLPIAHSFQTTSDARIHAARTLAGFGTGEIRPGALAAAILTADSIEAHRTWVEMSEEEIAQRRSHFRQSSSFHELTAQVGQRVAQHWSPPRQRAIPDGAIVELRLDQYGNVERAEIEHSTGREFYDKSVLNAALAAAPFSEVVGLPPWLRPEMQAISLTFGTPPISPDEHSRRRQSGLLREHRAGSPSVEEVQQLLTNELNEYAYYDHVRDLIEHEFISRNPGNFSPRSDAEIQVQLSLPLGVVLSTKVERSSGDRDFDNAARAAVDANSPFRELRNLTPVEQARMEYFTLHFHDKGIR